MSVIIASDLSKAFGPDDIFDGISLAIPDGARIALVGANGCLLYTSPAQVGISKDTVQGAFQLTNICLLYTSRCV